MANIHIFWFCLFASTISFAATGVSAQTRANYGEPCSRSTRCDSRASLTCTNGSCECIMPDVMAFDGAKCAVFAGEKCTFTAVDIQSRGEERSWREELPCVKNSLCQEGFCTCLPEFYESANGTCIRKSSYNGHCEFDLACKTDKLLFCNEEKKCGCNSTISSYSFSQERCLIVANVQCENGQECVSNANCNWDALRGENVCKCASDFFANPEGQCEAKRGYKQPCADNDYCQYGMGSDDMQLVCNADNLCGCRANFSTFDNSKHLCVRLAGVSCLEFPNCIINSECDSDEDCTCNSEYFQTSSGTCEQKRNHGKSCQADSHCSKDLKCGLIGLCECNKAEKVFDQSRQKCVGLADSHCNQYDSELQYCAPNAYCNGNRYGSGRCMCHDGYTKSQNGSCMASHGSTCGMDWTTACNEEHGTTCKGGVCRCKYDHFQTFDSVMNKCISRVPGPCDGDSIPCVPNAHCSDDDETFHQCVCDDGFVMVEGRCMLALGQSCDYSFNSYDNSDPFNLPGKTCDLGAPLKCIAGTCQCDLQEEYDSEAMKCRGLVGSHCVVGKEDYCAHNANCEVSRARSTVSETGGVCKCNEEWQTTRTKRCILDIAMREESQPTEGREIILDN